MKRILFLFVALLAVCSMSRAQSLSLLESAATRYTVTTDDRGNIAMVTSPNTQGYGDYAWHIRNVNGYTNVRDAPNGAVCMRLKAKTQYAIYVTGEVRGWLRISAIYNEREDYWVRLHSSQTGSYWIARSTVY